MSIFEQLIYNIVSSTGFVVFQFLYYQFDFF